MNQKPINIVIVGLGGQGILFIAKTIARTALAKGFNVVMNEVHGMAQRGGTVITNVRIGPVHSPMIADGQADIILSAEPHETLRVVNKISKNSLAIVSSVPVYPLTSFLAYDQYPPATEIFKAIKSSFPRVLFIDPVKIAENCGYTQAANMVLLGALAATKILPMDKDEILKIIKNQVNFWMWRVDKKAFLKGHENIQKQWNSEKDKQGYS